MKYVRDSGADLLTSALVFIAVVGLGLLFSFVMERSASPDHEQPKTFLTSGCTTPGRPRGAAPPVKVSSASGSAATLSIFIGRGGGDENRKSVPLAVQKGGLCPGGLLATATSDFVRSDGQTLPAYQVVSGAQIDNDGGHVTISVVVAPRYRTVSGPGEYTGTVALDDPEAVGANVPVTIDIEYPYLNRALAVSFLAAFGGFTWAWLIHSVGVNNADVKMVDSSENQNFLRNLVLRLAVLLAAAIPIANVQVISNPAWQGSPSQYINLATIVGAAAIAATPTLRALIMRQAPRSEPAATQTPVPAGK
jgi:hypothetical protein